MEIKVKDLAPLELKVFSVLVILAVNYKILTFTFDDVSPITYIICIAIAVGTWTIKSVVVVDQEKRIVGEGFKIAGLRYLSKYKFSEIEKVFVNSVSSGTTFRHLTRTMEIHHHTYKAYLKTVEGDKFCIAINADKDKLMGALQKYNQYIKTSIVDNT